MSQDQNYIGELNTKSQKEGFRYEFKTEAQEGNHEYQKFLQALYVNGDFVSRGTGYKIKLANQMAAKNYLYPEQAEKIEAPVAAIDRLTEAEKAKVREDAVWARRNWEFDHGARLLNELKHGVGSRKLARAEGTWLENDGYVCIGIIVGNTKEGHLTDKGEALLAELVRISK